MTLLRGYINLQVFARHPVACVIPCVRFNRFVRLSLLLLTAATLGTSGWLVLTRLGLSPSQKHQALLGALVGQFDVR